MATLKAGDIMQLTVRCQYGNQAGINVASGVLSSVSAGMTDALLAFAWRDKLLPVYKPWMAATASLVGVGIRRIYPDPTPTYYVVVTGGVGTGPGPIASAQTSGLITLKTEVAGRSGRGRKYIPFVSGTHVATGLALGTAGQTVLSNIAALYTLNQSLISGAESALWINVIRAATDTAGFIPIVSSLTHQGLATQRRRSYYGRENPDPASALLGKVELKVE